MLPPSHVTYTLAVFDALKEKFPALRGLDMRWLAIAAMGPDLIDKPLALAYFYRAHGSAVLFAHTGFTHLAVLLFTLIKRPKIWPYLLAFNGHAILDRLWFFPDTWYWPFRGWQFHEWKQEEKKDLSVAYWEAFTRRPELVRWELIGLLAGLWLVWRHRLYQPQRLLHFIVTGEYPQ
ncbi:MAG: hypothetical protein AAF629_20585 [Chloroflexota bacterium]